MAVIKAINSKASLKSIIRYVDNTKKTTKDLVSGKDIIYPSQAYEQMIDTKKMWNKTTGRQYKHFVQSFKEGEVTPRKANAIGQEWANENFKGYEVLVVTHTDKEHIHNHFVVNSVNFETGKKWSSHKDVLEKQKLSNDRICKSNGLSIPKKGNEITSFKRSEYHALKEGMEGREQSWKVQTAVDVKDSLGNSVSKEDFIKHMESKGYEVDWKDNRKNVTFKTSAGKKVRSKNLAKTFKHEYFTREGMKNELRRNYEQSRTNRNKAAEPRAQASTSNIQGDGQGQISKQSANGVIGRIEQDIHDATERVERVFRVDEPKDRKDADSNRTSESKHGKDSKQDNERFEPKQRESKSIVRKRTQFNGLER